MWWGFVYVGWVVLIIAWLVVVCVAICSNVLKKSGLHVTGRTRIVAFG